MQPFPTPVMLHIKYDQIWPTGLRNIQVRKFKFSSFKGKWLQSEYSDPAQNQTRPSFYACSGYQQL